MRRTAGARTNLVGEEVRQAHAVEASSLVANLRQQLVGVAVASLMKRKGGRQREGKGDEVNRKGQALDAAVGKQWPVRRTV